MDNVKMIPKMEYILEGGISPYAMDVQRATIKWAKDLKILNKDTKVSKYEKQKNRIFSISSTTI